MDDEVEAISSDFSSVERDDRNILFSTIENVTMNDLLVPYNYRVRNLNLVVADIKQALNQALRGGLNRARGLRVRQSDFLDEDGDVRLFELKRTESEFIDSFLDNLVRIINQKKEEERKLEEEVKDVLESKK